MPYPVATEILCNPKAKLTNAYRKTLQRARQTEYTSTLTKKPLEQKCMERMRKSTTPQLLKWAKRCVSKRRNLQQVYEKIKDRKGKKFDAMRTMLIGAANHLDEVAGAIDEVLNDRLHHYAMNSGPEYHVHPRHKRTYLPNKKICLAA